MLRSFIAGSTFLIVAFAAGCSGGADLESGGQTPSQEPSGESKGTGGAAAASTTELDTSSATSVVAASGYCGGAPGKCYGQESFELTFATSTLERSTCVPGEIDAETNQQKPSTTASTKRVLDAAEMQRVRDALGQVRVSSEPFIKQYDGNMFGLSVKSGSGTKEYSPEPSCGHDRFEKIVGFETLWNTLRSL